MESQVEIPVRVGGLPVDHNLQVAAIILLEKCDQERVCSVPPNVHRDLDEGLHAVEVV